MRRRSRQCTKLADTDERSLNVRLDLANGEAQAEKNWRDRLLEVAEAGFMAAQMIPVSDCAEILQRISYSVSGFTRLSVISHHRSLCTLRRRVEVLYVFLMRRHVFLNLWCRALRAEVGKYPADSDDAVSLRQRVQEALNLAKAASEQEMKRENREASQLLRRCASSKSLGSAAACDSDSEASTTRVRKDALEETPEAMFACGYIHVPSWRGL